MKQENILERIDYIQIKEKFGQEVVIYITADMTRVAFSPEGVNLMTIDVNIKKFIQPHRLVTEKLSMRINIKL